MRSNRKLVFTKKVIAGTIIVVLALLVGLGLTLSIGNKNDLSKPAQVVTYSTEKPDEKKPTESFTWKGAANDPKKIVIPSIGVDNFIQNVGVDQCSEIAVPSNIHLAGWFVDSVRPGEKGLSIIDGHLNGPNDDGIFINLEKVKQGDTVTVEFGDGTAKSFRVKTVQVIDLKDAADALYSQDPKTTSQLNLITCGGDYDPKSKLYDKRVVVIAARINA